MGLMTAGQFRAWRDRLGLTQAAAAAQLGITSRMVKMYEAGRHPSRRDDAGELLPVAIPRAIALACAAIEGGLSPE